MSRLLAVLCFGPMLVLACTSRRELNQSDPGVAQRVYVVKCAKCHRLYEPRDYSQEEWRLWMAKMSKKAKLTTTQEGILNLYLDAYRAQKPFSKLAELPVRTPGLQPQPDRDGKARAGAPPGNSGAH